MNTQQEMNEYEFPLAESKLDVNDSNVTTNELQEHDQFNQTRAELDKLSRRNPSVTLKFDNASVSKKLLKQLAKANYDTSTSYYYTNVNGNVTQGSTLTVSLPGYYNKHFTVRRPLSSFFNMDNLLTW